MTTPDEEYGILQYYHGQDSLKYESYERAIRFFTVAIQYNIELANSYRGIAKAQKGLGDYENAIKNYLKVIELEPNDAIAHNNLGNIYYKMGDYTNALLSYEIALSIDKTLSVAIENRFKTYIRFGEEPNIDESDFIHYKKGKELFENKDYENAVIEFNNAGGNQYCYFFKGLSYKMIKDADNAKQYLKEALFMNTVDFLIDEKEQNNFEQICNLEILECEGIETPEYIKKKKKLKEKKERARTKKLIKEFIEMFEPNEKINIETCKKKDLLKLDCFDKERVNKFLKLRKEGKQYYDIETFAIDLELQPHEMIEIQDKIIFPQKPKNKLGRKVDW